MKIHLVSKKEINASLSALNMSLMAESFGLGVLYSGFFTTVVNNSRKLRKSLNLKHNDYVVTTLVLGYPDVRYRRTT